MKKIFILGGIIFLGLVMSAYAFFGKKAPEPFPMTFAELAQYDGQNGNPAYVAVDGKVYDLSKCRYWKEGVHVESPEEGIAGRDMTELLKTSKHGIKRVARYPYVAYIVEEGQATGE